MNTNRWAVVEVTQPSVEPVTVDETKDRLRIDTTAEDTDIGNMIKAARQWTENYLSFALVQRQLRLYLDVWPASDVIELPRSNLVSIDTVQYVDIDGNVQTWADTNYEADTASFVGRLLLDPDSDYPSIRAQRQAVMITYTAGYPDDNASPPDYTANIPQDIKDAIVLKVGEAYEFRENRQKMDSEYTGAAENLLHPHRRVFL